MSLINDALKRASQTAKDRPNQANLSTPMEPVREPARSEFKFIFVAAPAAVVIVALAGWFFFQWFSQRHAHPPALAPTTAAQLPATAPMATHPNPASQPRATDSPAALGQSAGARTTTAVTPVSAIPVQRAGTNAAPPVRATAPLANPPIAGATSRQAAATVPAPAPMPATVVTQPRPAVQSTVTFPKLQVKGIFYNSRRPYALINGETVSEGEHVLGVRVVKIQPQTVTVELDGHTKQLALGE
jgi:cytoskeletal protein RodZ